MNKDLIVGLLVSAVLHFAVLNPFMGKQPPPKRIVEKKDDTVQFTMAPPSLVDLPTVVPVQAFTQPLAPPPPPGLTPNKGAINIPVTKPGANFGKGLKDLFDINNLDQKPIARVQQAPQYPYEMSRAGISGEVVVEFIINSNGDVIQTQVVRSSHREFEVPAMQCVSKWKFKPGRKGGRAVSTKASQLIEFNLEDNK